MPGAIIVADQPTGAGAGVAGTSRKDLWLSQLIALSCFTGGNVSYAWELLAKPAGSSASLSSTNTASSSFTPDLPGTYRVKLTTNGGGPGNVQILVFRVRFDASGVLVQRGWALPAVGERYGESNYAGNTRGWSEPLEYIFEDIRTNLGGGGGGDGALTPTATKTANYTAQVGDFVFYDPTGGTFTITFPPAVGDDGARVGFHNASDSWVKVRLAAADSIDGLGGITLMGPRATLLARAKGDVWHTESRSTPPRVVIPLLAGLRSTAALVGSKEELGGVWLDLSEYAWATSAQIAVYARSSDGVHQANVELYDGDAAVTAAPTSMGTAGTLSTPGELLTVDVSALLTVAGGSGVGWFSLLGWCSAGASLLAGRADLIIS